MCDVRLYRKLSPTDLNPVDGSSIPPFMIFSINQKEYLMFLSIRTYLVQLKIAARSRGKIH